MRESSCPGDAASRAARTFAGSLIVLLVVTAAVAQPITYTGFVITDGQLGAWQFHNARVILTFQSDTDYVQQLVITIPPHSPTNVVVNTAGTARIRIIDHEKTVDATIDPNQIFVSYDQSNHGAGFGSMVPKVPFPDSIISPVYPLAISHGVFAVPTGGIACSNNFGVVSAEECDLPINLKGDAAFAGFAWSCFGIPHGEACTEADPTQKIGLLTTDKGALYLFQTYDVFNGFFDDMGNKIDDTMNMGFFFQRVGDSRVPLPYSIFAPSSRATSGLIVYNTFLISDVSIGGELIHGASVHLSFSSTINGVRPLPGPGGLDGYINEDGIGRVTITKGSRTITATLAPHEMYVFFDQSNASVGFGSYSGGPSYPVYLSAGPNGFGEIEDLTTGVSIIIANSGASSFYTPNTAALAQITDLKHETLLASWVTSCTPILQSTSFFPLLYLPCSFLNAPPRLSTNRGDFYLYMPYWISYPPNPATTATTTNTAVFWTSFPLDSEGDE